MKKRIVLLLLILISCSVLVEDGNARRGRFGDKLKNKSKMMKRGLFVVNSIARVQSEP